MTKKDAWIMKHELNVLGELIHFVDMLSVPYNNLDNA